MRTVPSADDYRELADSFKSAREAHNEDERMRYLTLAQTWLEEVSRRDSATPVRGSITDRSRRNVPLLPVGDVLAEGRP